MMLWQRTWVLARVRDHIVNFRSGCRSLVVVNVHFEPELTLWSLSARLRLITPRWPHYPDAIGVIMGDFNICEPEEERFNVWNQTFTDGDTRKAAIFRFFLAFSILPSLPLQGETLQSMELYARPGLVEHFSISPRLKHATSIATLMSLKTVDNVPYRVTMQPFVWLFLNRRFGGTRAHAFRVGCPNMAFSAQF